MSFDVSQALRNKNTHSASKDLSLGYPINLSVPPKAFFQWRQELTATGINIIHHNNVGNPYEETSPLPHHTHDFEKEVVKRFGKLLEFDEENLWGFVSQGGTDGNMHGLYIGRVLLTGQSGIKPKIYFTREAHYSMEILSSVLDLQKVIVNASETGVLDIENLAEKLALNADTPALIVAALGSTFKGAIDPLDNIRACLKHHPLPSYIHVDAALFGGYLPHTSYAHEVQHFSPTNPSGRYDSIAISCHKFFGFPNPAGLFFMTRKSFEAYQKIFKTLHNPEYVHQVPGTIACSRSAVNAAEFFFFSTPSALKTQHAEAQDILKKTTYLHQQLKTSFPHLMPLRASEASNTILFQKPSARIVQKYSLATMELDVKGELVPFAHVVMMQHVKQNILDQFLEDLS